MDSANFTPRSFTSSTNALDVNCGPLLDMILSGNPNLLYKLLSKSSAVPLAVIVLLHGMRITPLLSPWSTMTNMESKFLIGGKSVMKSMEQWAKGRVVVARSVGMNEGLEGCQLILNCWHIPHPLT